MLEINQIIAVITINVNGQNLLGKSWQFNLDQNQNLVIYSLTHLDMSKTLTREGLKNGKKNDKSKNA